MKLKLHFPNYPQEYSLDLYLAMAWQDPRLALGINRTISLAGDYMAKFWIPDIFFVNSVHAEIHKMLLPNQKVWVNLEGGHIMLSARLAVCLCVCVSGCLGLGLCVCICVCVGRGGEWGRWFEGH